jgi:hypothetical protein
MSKKPKSPSKRKSEITRVGPTTKPEAKSDKKPHRHYLKPSPKLKLVSAKKLAKTKVPPGKPLWGTLILKGMLGMFTGPRGGGKTFATLSLAVCIASNCEVWGYGPSKPRNVVVLDGEMGFRLMQERIKIVCDAIGTKPPRNLRLLNPDLYDGVLPSLATAEGQKLIDALIPEDTDLIIIDNFSCWNRGGDEHADGWSIWNSWLLSHKRKGRTVILVHHTGKNGDQRGASNREDSLDFVITLKPVKNSNHPGALCFDLEWTKARHLARDQVYPIRATLLPENAKGERWVHEKAPTEDEKVLKARALRAEGKKPTEIAQILGVNKSTISRWFKSDPGAA